MKKILIALLVTVVSSFANAQVKVKIGSLSDQAPGTTVHLPVLVFGLDATNGGTPVSAMEFHINYPNDMITYDTTMNFNTLVPLTQWYFGASPTEYATNWIEPSNGHLNIPDSTVLFEIVFQYLGGQATLDFNQTTSIILDSVYNGIPEINYINGMISPTPGVGSSRWNGTGSWNTLANWSNGIPGDSTDAIVESGDLSIFSNAISKSMTINSGSTLTISPNFSLTVHHDFTNNGTFRVQSDTGGTGSLIINGNAGGTGSNTIERYLDFSSGFSHLVSSPVQNSTATVFGGMVTEKYSESSASWTAILPSDVLTTGNGFRVNGTTTTTSLFTGSLNIANVSLTDLTYNNGSSPEFNGLYLAGNPFQSAIQWNQGNWVKTNLDGAVYGWSGYKYVAWNGTIGSLTNGIIPAMQGFFVKSHASGGALTIPVTARIHDHQPFYMEKDALSNVLAMRLESTSDILHFDESFINVLPGSTDGFDSQTDALKLFGNNTYPQLYTLSPDKTKFSINTIPAFNNVPVGFQVGAAGSYKITFTEISSFNPDQPIFFEDKSAGASINIRNVSSYVFSTDTLIQSGRFVLHFEVIGIDNIPNTSFRAWLSDNVLHLSALDNQKEILHAELFNLSGQSVFSSDRIQLPATFRLNDLHGGVYVLKLYTNEGVYSKKLIMI